MCHRRAVLAVVPERVAAVETAARLKRMLEELDYIADDATRGGDNCRARLAELEAQASALASSDSVTQRLINGAGRSGLALGVAAAAVDAPQVRPPVGTAVVTVVLCRIAF